MFYGASIFSGFDEEEIFGFSPLSVPPTQIRFQPESVLNVKSSVCVRRDSLAVVPSVDEGTVCFRFVFDAAEACLVTVKVSAEGIKLLKSTKSYPATLSQVYTVNLKMEDLERNAEGIDRIFKVVIRIKSAGAGTGTGTKCSEFDLEKQVTSCAIVTNGTGPTFTCITRVLSQTVKFNGTMYVVHDVFGQECTEKESDYCAVCLSEKKSTICIPCRHFCVCQECAQVLKAQSNKCPICRSTVRTMLQVTKNSSEEEHTDTDKSQGKLPHNAPATLLQVYTSDSAEILVGSL